MQTSNRGFVPLCLALIGACAVCYLFGWVIPLMEIDAVQYANISREMLHNGTYLQLYDQGKDYLDKPPMLFWLGALSMRIFGVHDWAYRLPSFFFALLAVYSTYRLALLFYKKEIAALSALVLASCQALFLINHDVRTDTMLMGWVTLALWQLAAWYRSGAWRHLLLASIALAGGMMTKGPIALMVPVFCFLPHFVLQRNFRQFFRWEYLALLVLIGLLLIPMCIGLYQQYDLHPGKVIDGKEIRSGLRFFFWTQSFGRITGESQWHENDSFFFLFQNMLWSFLPWIIFFVVGLFRDLRHIVRSRFRLPEGEEWITTGGFLLTYCCLGLSHYQLPHYIFVVFPLAAIIAGKAVYETASGKVLWVTHLVIFCLLWVALFAVVFLPFPTPVGFKVALVIAALVWLWLLIRYQGTRLTRLVVLGVGTMLAVNFFVDFCFYPRLLDYQLHSVVMTGMAEQHIAPERLFVYNMDEERALDFYTNHLYAHTGDPDTLSDGFILTNKAGLDSLGNRFDVIYTGGFFHVSTLDIGFLNPSTRATELTPVYILRKRSPR
ncbi:ArnT family glycosyltransferase [Dinghuibacter silviterrae]|uniref:4-amino-4-deoxy-L-arabinose transferase-like glycosyltransferase n=1 Tax=Dinghuibacter silviterrae TaxID=1539049 RepID=A0A4R8DEW5_9BACT|nr:glycosyltransferase family 39 protein [Dinghuibacter silviterrae]TDW96101.1 4-amino-4-deoxy-L-arabinose transferase-like glycosyltransferase [Dinghuibacter silviterrae]